MKIKATFAREGEWWVAWTEDVPGALTQGKTLEEARENLAEAVNEILKPVDLASMPNREVVIEELEV